MDLAQVQLEIEIKSTPITDFTDFCRHGGTLIVNAPHDPMSYSVAQDVCF